MVSYCIVVITITVRALDNPKLSSLKKASWKMLKIAIESDRFTYPTADSLFEISLHLICLFMELSKSWITSSVTWTRSLMKYLVVNSHILSVLNTGKLEDVKVNCTLLSALYSLHTHTHFCNLCLWKEKPKNKSRNGNAKETKVSLIGRRIWWTVSEFDWAFARRISYI